jgi:large subunit ribosomal protein L1
MNKQQILETIKDLRSNSKERKFKQTFDVIINFKDLDLKKNNVDFFANLSHDRGKKIKICAIVDHELEAQAKENCDLVILKKDLDKYKKDLKLVKKVSKEYDFFIAQANLMGLIATVFGRVLGPLGKMPNPKVGGVLPPTGQLKPVVSKFKKLVRLMTKKEPIVKLSVGKEEMKDDDVAENIYHIYEQLVHNLPKGQANIKNVLIKFTMSKPLKVGEKEKK